MSKHKKKSRVSPLFVVLFLAMLGVFAVAAYNLATYYLDNNYAKNVTEELYESAVKIVEQTQVSADSTKPLAPTESAEPIAPAMPTETEGTNKTLVTTEKEIIEEEAVTFEFVNERAPITVDFNALKEQGIDAKGWIYCADTDVNFPIMQSEDNSYYLHRLPNGKESYSGSIFMDYRCPSDFIDNTIVIYGHNMKNGSMFGKLNRYLSQSYYENHPVWYMVTPEKCFRLEIFAGFVASERQSHALSYLTDKAERLNYIEEVTGISRFTSIFERDDTSPITAIVTCSEAHDQTRYILLTYMREILHQ